VLQGCYKSVTHRDLLLRFVQFLSLVGEAALQEGEEVRPPLDLLGVTRVLQGCYKMLQGCYKGVTRVLQGCYKGVTRMLQGCYKGVGEAALEKGKEVCSPLDLYVLQGCYKGVT
jgi:hypothetical protein